MSALRILQVGLGAHGRNWARRVIPDAPEVEVAGYVDTDPYSLQIARQEIGGSPTMYFESLKEALTATAPEAVLNTTALPGHVPVTRTALDAGLHVLLEKPFAPTLGAAHELVDVAARAGLVLMISQNYRYFPAPRALAEIVREGRLGKLHEVSIDFRRYSTAGPNGRGRHHLEDQPLLVDMSIHHFDLLRLILGTEPLRIYCEAWNPRWSDFSGPSVTVASIAFDGVVVSYRGSWVTAGRLTPWAGEWHLEFEHAEVVWESGDDDRQHDRVLIRPRKGRARSVHLPQMERTGPLGTLTEFARAVRSGREPETSGRNNLGTIAFVAAAVESATVHEPVSIYRAGEALPV
ncbi:MAG TPA: Gfo/Idh/MocA family oxidoreductase [Candidatus Dormibacteraeota bacterium]|nr:Gfo/Idh/MocA family oxidoreductase [Candidatus Dormibacteraeota bacterium]